MTGQQPQGADLHLHTIFSDGTYTPEDLVAGAERKGLAAIGLTDHDTLDGFERASQAAESAAVEVIPGVEFSCPSQGDREEAHIVGLFLDSNHDELQNSLKKFRENRRRRAIRMVEELNRAGLALRSDDVFGLAGVGNVSRLHVAQAIVAAGHVSSIEAAFREYIRNGARAYVPRERPLGDWTIGLIHRAGGVAILAHPGLTKRDDDIPSLAAQGLDALEAYCPDHDSIMEQHYLDIATHHQLLVSAGSDCHGHNKSRSRLGSIRLDSDHLEALRERASAK